MTAVNVVIVTVTVNNSCVMMTTVNVVIMMTAMNSSINLGREACASNLLSPESLVTTNDGQSNVCDLMTSPRC